MREFTWTAAEKKIARKAFDHAVEAELRTLTQEFKARANSVKDPSEIWEIRDWLNKRQVEIDSEFDYRYSQLIHVFGNLVGRRKLELDQLAGLSDDKIEAIRFLSGF